MGPEVEEGAEQVVGEVDAACALARRVCEQAQLATVVASSNGLLAAAPLPVEATADRMERARVLAVARRLAAELDGTLGVRGAVRATLTLHVAGAEVRGDGAGAEFAGGDLFRLSEWAAREFGGLFATGAA